jgi:hypothetical protein
VFTSFEVQRIVPEPDDFRMVFNDMVGRSNRETQSEMPIGLLERFDEFTREMGHRNQWTAATYEKFSAVRNHILRHKPDATFGYFDEVQPKYMLLGTHSGRRTFICNALILGIAPHVVMKWTGHNDYKSMRPYN